MAEGTAPAGTGRSMPAAVPVIHSIPDAVDAPYEGGTIGLDIDASDTGRGIWRVTETVPVTPGTTSLVLMLPQWLPGDHEPSGRADHIADLRFLVDGQPVRWWRDPLEGFAFHLELPAGASRVVAHFVHTSPLLASEGEIIMTREMLNLEWSNMSLYPAGHYVRQVQVRPSVTLPAGWGFASALDGPEPGANHVGTNHVGTSRIDFAETDYETLIDSPVFAGINFKRFELGHGVALDAVADNPEDLVAAPEALPAYKALVDEALLTFGSRHFDHYDFLVGLTDRLGGVGLEHHRSSENTMSPRALADWAGFDWDRNVLAHEFSHSWNGKFRRPADLWTPDYRTPMQDDLLWVYEGQTQFWGYVLAVRSGVQSKDMILGEIASDAGKFSQQAGRAWRSVEDTTSDPVISERRPEPFPSIERNEEYYEEGALVWLEVDQIIRAGTHGQRGLDDFARAFFGVRDGNWGEVTYGFDDVVATLNGVYAYDWASFLKDRIELSSLPAPLAGIEKAGYRLVWKDTPNPYDKAMMASSKDLDLSAGIGIDIGSDGRVTSCRWDSAAFNAGIVTGAKIVAVNGETYDADAMKSAITAARADATRSASAVGQNLPVTLIVQRGDRVETIAIPYHDGLRWPWLERASPGSGPAGLDLLLRPRRPHAG